MLGVGDGWGGVACCSPWGLKELDTIERLNDTNNKENQTNECDAKEKQTHRPRKQTDD